MLIKFAFLFSIPVYVAIAWVVSQNGAQPDGISPSELSIFAAVLAATYAISVVLVEPILGRRFNQRFGGYSHASMIVRLAFFQSGAIYGLLLSLLSYDLRYVLGFGLVAFLLILVRVPVSKFKGVPQR